MGGLYARGETIDFQKIKFLSAMGVRVALYTRGYTINFPKLKFASATGAREREGGGLRNKQDHKLDPRSFVYTFKYNQIHKERNDPLSTNQICLGYGGVRGRCLYARRETIDFQQKQISRLWGRGWPFIPGDKRSISQNSNLPRLRGRGGNGEAT